MRSMWLFCTFLGMVFACLVAWHPVWGATVVVVVVVCFGRKVEVLCFQGRSSGVHLKSGGWPWIAYRGCGW